MSTTNMANDNQTASNTTADDILSSRLLSQVYLSTNSDVEKQMNRQQGDDPHPRRIRSSAPFFVVFIDSLMRTAFSPLIFVIKREATCLCI